MLNYLKESKVPSNQLCAALAVVFIFSHSTIGLYFYSRLARQGVGFRWCGGGSHTHTHTLMVLCSVQGCCVTFSCVFVTGHLTTPKLVMHAPSVLGSSRFLDASAHRHRARVSGDIVIAHVHYSYSQAVTVHADRSIRVTQLQMCSPAHSATLCERLSFRCKSARCLLPRTQTMRLRNCYCGECVIAHCEFSSTLTQNYIAPIYAFI